MESKVVHISNKEYYMEPCLCKALNRIKESVLNKDADSVLVVDGAEGSGKSVFAMQIAFYLDETLKLERVCMHPEEFKTAIMKAQKGQAVIFDEAYFGLSSRASLSAINKILVSKMMEMRQKNLFVIICIPSFFLLDRYVSLFRSKALFHIYQRGNNRFWLGFNQKNKKILYLLGRKLMNYYKPYIYKFRGRFFGKYVLDEQEYREKKKKALEESEILTEDSKFMLQRDLLIDFIRKKLNLSYREMEKTLIDAGLKENLHLSYPEIYHISKKLTKNPKNV